MRGSQGGTQLTLLPLPKQRAARCPQPPDLASCLPHLITEMSSPEGSLLLLTVVLYFPPAASAAILLQGGERRRHQGNMWRHALALASPEAQPIENEKASDTELDYPIAEAGGRDYRSWSISGPLRALKHPGNRSFATGLPGTNFAKFPNEYLSSLIFLMISGV